MTRNWFITEKIISAALIIWGGLSFYYSSRGVFYLLNAVTWKDLSISNTFKNFHIMFFLPLVTIIAGLLLFFNKKIGWTMSLIALFLNAFVFLIPKDKYTNNFNSNGKGLILFTLITTIGFLTTFIILLLKPFQAKYNPTKKTWLTIVLITFVVMLDRTLIFLFS